jgi:hypothetical protein
MAGFITGKSVVTTIITARLAKAAANHGIHKKISPRWDNSAGSKRTFDCDIESSNKMIKDTPAPTPAQGRTEKSEQIEAPFRWAAIKTRLEDAAARAVESARAAYNFNPGHYTAKALADVVAIKTLLGWLNDLGQPK